MDFFLDGNKWRCTDKGARTICAIRLDKEDDSWYRGPPYAVLEVVFDEDDVINCVQREDEEP